MNADQQPSPEAAAGAKPPQARRSTAAEISAALDLGWRVAALHALRPTQMTAPSPVTDDMLLNRRSLSASDRVELEVRAIAGVAARVGVGLHDARLLRLLTLAGSAGETAEDEQAFRAALGRQHLAFEKQLWATDEPSGKAYELGNFLSDSWNRVVRPMTTPDAHSELREIFGAVRVERMKILLDDLQARIDPVAVHAVSNHLDQWRDRVRDAPYEATLVAADGSSTEQIVAQLEPVERQTVIWRQLLTGAKEPEAYIGHARRSEVRDELTRQAWKRYGRRLRWLLPLVAVLGGGLAILYVRERELAQGLIGSALALLGTVGVTRASMTGALKRGMQTWGDLMWNRSLAAVICRETSVVDELFAPVVKQRPGMRPPPA